MTANVTSKRGARDWRSARRSAGLALATLVAAGAWPLAAAAASTPGDRLGVRTNPYAAMTAGHAYRHGLVPTVPWTRTHAATLLDSSNNLTYGGGLDGVAVTIGVPRVYVVFWGSQWGTRGTDAHGNATFSGDPAGVAPDLQAFFRGLGTSGDTWSGVMTQYCEGVAQGAQDCPGGAAHVGYPTGGALAGVWEDASATAPAVATGHQIAAEAVAAATHFGQTTQASNRSTQYVVVSPTGTDPDDYQNQGFCGWHDYTGDSTLSGGGGVTSPDGELAFTNLPYLPDAGSSCGEDFVNGASGALDGVTIVGGHEYAETLTDQFPAGGWLDGSGNETGDKCAWIQSGQGASQDITLSTGTFAVQSTWANDFGGGTGGCEVSHPVVSGVTAPGTPASVSAVPGNGSAQVRWTAPGTDGGSTITEYTASASPGGATCSSAATQCAIGGLKPTTSYTFSVVATNAVGPGPSAVTARVFPFNPTGLGLEVITPVLSRHVGFVVIAGGAAPGAKVQLSMPGAVAKTCIADSVGQCTATTSASKNGVFGLRSRSGSSSSTLRLFVPLVSVPATVKHGGTALFVVEDCPAGTKVSVSLSDGRKLSTTATSGGKATLRVAVPRAAKLTATTAVDGIILAPVSHVDVR